MGNTPILKFESIVVGIAAALTVLPAHGGEIDAAAIVAAHNKWRAAAGVTVQLSYSPELAEAAQAWADNLKRTHNCRMQHSKSDGKYGENLYWASAIDWSDGRKELQRVSPWKIVDSWGSEKTDYDHASNSCAIGKICGHYTQMVWRTTTAVGCAMAVCEDTLEQVWVCRYQPAGNWAGRKPY